MTTTRVTLTTAALIAAVLAVQGIVLDLWNLGILGIQFAAERNAGSVIGSGFFWELLVNVLHCAAFGLGVYLALRFFASLDVGAPWRSTIVRGVVATVSGAVVAFAFSALISLIAAVTIGAYPLGYSFSAGIDASEVQYGIWNAMGAALTPLIEWLPLTVLGAVFLRLWLTAHQESEGLPERVTTAS